jgi:hypothetical protein
LRGEIQLIESGNLPAGADASPRQQDSIKFSINIDRHRAESEENRAEIPKRAIFDYF